MAMATADFQASMATAPWTFLVRRDLGKARTRWNLPRRVLLQLLVLVLVLVRTLLQVRTNAGWCGRCMAN